jgi:hypothetical protein
MIQLLYNSDIKYQRSSKEAARQDSDVARAQDGIGGGGTTWLVSFPMYGGDLEKLCCHLYRPMNCD